MRLQYNKNLTSYAKELRKNLRDLALNKLSIKVLRYSNADINIRFNSVMKDLYQNIHSRL